MTKRERLQFFWLWVTLGLLPLFLRPLWGPDEERYAEIPREMLASGNWLTPTLNQVLYFEKPPFQYWISAVSMKLFGLNAVAARLPLALAALIAMWCAWRLARRLGASQPMWAAFMMATTLLGFVCGQILTLDAFFSALLVLSLVAFIEAVAARYEERPALGWTLLAFGANALALLTKGLAGPVLLGGMILGSLPLARKDVKLRRALLRSFLDPFGWLVFAVIGGPWFVLVNRANPGHAQFFFIHEHFARFTTTVHARQGSDNAILDKLYFAGILLAGLLPWLSASVLGLKRAGGFLFKRRGPASEHASLHRWMVAFLILAFAVPFLFFSVSSSKLPPYIMPVLVPLAALACAFERDEEAWTALKRCGVELLVLGALMAAVVPTLKDVRNPVWPLALAFALILLGCWALRPRRLTGPRWMVALGAGMLLLSVTAVKVVGPDKDIARLLKQAPAEAQWISYGIYHQGLPFHTGQRVTIVAGTGELAFGRDRLTPAERQRWFQEDPAQFLPVAQRLRLEAPQRPVWALSHRNAWGELPEHQQALWEVVDRNASTLLLRLK
jgi:4-amino-4-deoxy-L-arabinose transferase-like glycosyltransferase